jgi:hypothetical protein
MAEDGREVAISMQKENQMEWWKCVIIGDPEIDTTKVRPAARSAPGKQADEM